MNKKRIAAALAAVLTVTAFAGCKRGKEAPAAPTAQESRISSELVPVSGERETDAAHTEEETAEAATASPTEAASEATTEKTEPSSAPETAAPETAPAQTEAPALPANASGVTSKGYTIETVNGITYVDGVLIANKTYALPADYNPGSLTGECSAAFSRMAADAAEEGLSLYVLSGFRSYETQAGLYDRYCARDGQAAADRYSARPGHSEHQTGLAIDVNSVSYDFEYTAEGKWLAANCHRYGFILRYLQEKEWATGYRYEPWHIRYVGVETAAKIHDSGLSLEEYYGITSVYS